MKKSLVILFVAALGLAACKNEKKGPGGLLYTIHHSAGKEKIKEGDIVKVNFIQKNDRDTIINSTYDNEMGQVFAVGKRAYAGDNNDILYLLGEGDSASFKLNLDTMAFYTKQPKPDQYKNDKYLHFTIKIEKVFSKKANEADSTFQNRARDFFQADYKTSIEKVKNAEDGKIKAFIADQNLKTKTTPNGLSYVINAPGNAQRPQPGDTVLISYTGKLLKKRADGKYKIFDTSDEKIAKEAKVYQMGRPYGPTKMVLEATVPGFGEAVRLVGKGGKIFAIFPSKLGWGENGAPQGGIGPYNPVAFDIEVVDIIKGVAPAPAPAAPMPAAKK